MHLSVWVVGPVTWWVFDDCTERPVRITHLPRLTAPLTSKLPNTEVIDIWSPDAWIHLYSMVTHLLYKYIHSERFRFIPMLLSWWLFMCSMEQENIFHIFLLPIKTLNDQIAFTAAIVTLMHTFRFDIFTLYMATYLFLYSSKKAVWVTSRFIWHVLWSAAFNSKMVFKKKKKSIIFNL